MVGDYYWCRDAQAVRQHGIFISQPIVMAEGGVQGNPTRLRIPSSSLVGSGLSEIAESASE